MLTGSENVKMIEVKSRRHSFKSRKCCSWLIQRLSHSLEGWIYLII